MPKNTKINPQNPPKKKLMTSHYNKNKKKKKKNRTLYKHQTKPPKIAKDYKRKTPNN